jgi:hypothetical protein
MLGYHFAKELSETIVRKYLRKDMKSDEVKCAVEFRVAICAVLPGILSSDFFFNINFLQEKAVEATKQEKERKEEKKP